MKATTFLLAVMLTILPALAAKAQSQLQISLAADRIAIDGATRGGGVALFAVTLKSERGMQTLRRFQQVLVDDDRDGSLTLDPSGGVPLRSIWTAVDIQSGSRVVRVPEGYELSERLIDVKEFRKDAGGALDAFSTEHLTLDFLLVRPGAGAWTLRAREGGDRDGDRSRDGKLTVLFESAVPMEAAFGKAPKHLKTGDVLIAIDPGRMELMTWTVTK